MPPTVYHEIVTQGAGRAGAAEIASGDWEQVHALVSRSRASTLCSGRANGRQSL